MAFKKKERAKFLEAKICFDIFEEIN